MARPGARPFVQFLCAAGLVFLLVDCHEDHEDDGTDPSPPNPHGARTIAPGIRVLGGTVSGFVIEGDQAYLLRRWGIDVYDISGAEPVLLGWGNTDGNRSYLTVKDGLAYAGSYHDYELVVYDVSDPRNIHELGRLTATDNMMSGVMIGDYGYFANRYDGLAIVDVSDPTLPQITSSVDTGYCGRVRFLGGMLFVTTTTSGVNIYELSDPTAPSQIGHVTSTWSSQNVALKGDTLLVAEGLGAMQIVDISDPAFPSDLDTVPSLDYGLDVAWYGDFAYLADSTVGVHVIDANPPDSASLVKTLADTGGYARDLLVHADRLYVTDSAGGVVVYDLADPADPQLVTRLARGSWVQGLAVTGDLAYVTCRYALGVWSLDREQMLGSAALVEYSEEVAVADGIAYCEGNEFGTCWIDVVDASDPAALASIDRHQFATTSVHTQRIVPRDSVLFATRSTAGLETYDITDPAAMQSLDSYATGGTALGLVLRDNLAFVGDTTNGLVVLNVADPTNITYVSSLPEANTGWVALAGDVAYTADSTPLCIRVLDVSEPAAPFEVTSVPLAEGSHQDLAVQGDHLYVAAGTGGLYVYDITDPRAPVLEGRLFTNGDTRRVTGWGSLVVVGDMYAGLFLVDPDLALP